MQNYATVSIRGQLGNGAMTFGKTLQPLQPVYVPIPATYYHHNATYIRFTATFGDSVCGETEPPLLLIGNIVVESFALDPPA